MLKSPLIVALDSSDIDEAQSLAARLGDHAGAFKIGLQLFVAHGSRAVSQIEGHGPIFLDLKFYDIPTQVKGAARAAAGLGVWMITVHGASGVAAMRAAVEGAELGRRSGRARPLVVAVTVLTSSQEPDPGRVEDTVRRLARDAMQAGVDGVVCSAIEARAVREVTDASALVVVPGVRMPGGSADDQARVATPAEALRAGANYIVVGRPITMAPNPVHAAGQILSSLPARAALRRQI